MKIRQFNSLLHLGYITCNRHEEQQNHHHYGSMAMHITNIQISASESTTTSHGKCKYTVARVTPHEEEHVVCFSPDNLQAYSQNVVTELRKPKQIYTWEKVRIHLVSIILFSFGIR